MQLTYSVDWPAVFRHVRAPSSRIDRPLALVHAQSQVRRSLHFPNFSSCFVFPRVLSVNLPFSAFYALRCNADPILTRLVARCPDMGFEVGLRYAFSKRLKDFRSLNRPQAQFIIKFFQRQFQNCFIDSESQEKFKINICDSKDVSKIGILSKFYQFLS